MPRHGSPWIGQYERGRPLVRIETNEETDVCVIGGGIAGVSVLYQGLRRTGKRFILLEADKVGHGASGHNAGQAVDRFERPLRSIAADYGTEAAAMLQAETTAAWSDLEELCAYAGVELVQVRGKTILSQRWHLDRALGDNEIMRIAGLEADDILLAEDSALLNEDVARHVTAVPRHQLDEMHIAKAGSCEGVAFSRRGCVNSSLLSERVVERLLRDHPGRVLVYEASAVRSVDFGDRVIVHTDRGQVSCGHAVLCTNGFDAASTTHGQGLRMTPVFGVVACMLAYFEADRGPEVLTYLPKKEGYYFYLTRRRSPEGALVCVGGPERKLAEEERFEHRNDLVPGGREEIQHFLLANLPEYEAREDHPFFWSGLMGYNQTGIRLAGPHPAEPRLLLDLGCNGIGILPSLAASRRIAAHLRGESPSPSLFDPGTQARPQ